MRQFSVLPSVLIALTTTATSAVATPEEESHGVQIDTITPATCGRPTQHGDRIRVNYRGRLQSTGEEFDNSYDRGEPFTFMIGIGKVIQGWDMALLGMCPGEGRRLTIPPELGYGNLAMGKIPAGSTLIFDTELVEILDVKQPAAPSSKVAEVLSSASPTPTASLPEKIEEAISIATAPATPSEEESDSLLQELNPVSSGSEDGPMEEAEKAKKRCQLLGPFALLVQGALGGFAILTLVWKRYREKPQRPWKIWFFDVSKQVFGSMLTHVLNVAMSMLSSVQIANHAEAFASLAKDKQGHYPNPCSYYLLNLAIDTTLGIPVLYILLIVIHALFLRTPLARPPQSIKSGSYGEPPKWAWYLKQLLIYFIGLTGMKLCVFLLFSLLPWLPWVGDWALRWTQFDERVEIAFAMFIFPLIMNAIQYYVIDNLIMDRSRDKVGYQSVQVEEEGRDEEERLVGDEDEDERFKLDDDEEEPLKDAEIEPAYSSSGQSTLRGDEDINRKLK